MCGGVLELGLGGLGGGGGGGGGVRCGIFPWPFLTLCVNVA